MSALYGIAYLALILLVFAFVNPFAALAMALAPFVIASVVVARRGV